MSEITTIVNEALPMQLDSVSWNKRHNVVAIGAYMIDPSNTEKRIGKIFLIQLKCQNDKVISYETLQEINVNGVLDLRWEPNEEETLAVATSESLDLYELLVNEGEFSLNVTNTNSLDLECMALYVQWIDKDKLVYSDSDGAINIVATSPIQRTATKKIHANLTWVVQYSPTLGLLFAGSDEGKFTGFLLENIEDEEKHFTKKFQVGVTSIIFFGENILAVGSYDDTLKIFTIDSVDPVHLLLKKKIEFGGAVWRTISFPAEANSSATKEIKNFYIVTACARNGIHIIHLNCENWSYKTLTTCLDHEGFLAYGLDAKLEEGNHTFTIVSCYFDNQQLHVWETNLPQVK